MELSQRGALWIIAAGVIAAVLYFLREPLSQFALAALLWLVIHSFTERLERVPLLPRWLAHAIAIVLVLGLTALVGFVVVNNLGAILGDLARYELRLNQVLAQLHAAVGAPGQAPVVRDLIAHLDPARIATEVGQSLQNLVSSAIFTLIFLGFLFSAAALMPAKLDLIFTDPQRRALARDVGERIRQSMERYLWVQTLMSLVITALTFLTLSLIGLENALFWSFLIFFLNYIPTIGSLAAVVLTTAVALVQFPTLGPVAAVFLGVSAWQFLIGNFLQPRMTGDSLNLSAVVVLLALSIWGAMWGIVGAFLSAPLTVMLMIVLAQFRSTRWIAILLSEDGKPTPHAPSVQMSDSGTI